MKYLPLIALFLGLPLVALAQEFTGYVPLTNVPFLTETGNAFSLDSFLNGLYRLCIGIAAVVAVLQIMRAGIMYMGGDSVTEKKEARNLIAMSIGGLILVLSPVVVFSLVNPEILTLRIGNLEDLKVGTSAGETAGTGDGTCSVACDASQGQICRSGQCVAITEDTCPTQPIGDGVSVPSQRAQSCCAAQAGCSVQVSSANGGVAVCSCVPPTNEQFAWKGTYYVDSDCGLGRTDTPPNQCSTQVLRGGAYRTKEQCQREYDTATEGKTRTGSLYCTCDTNIGSQLSEYCLSDAP